MIICGGDLQMADKLLEMGVHGFQEDADTFLLNKIRQHRTAACSNCDESLIETAKYFLALGMMLEHLSVGYGYDQL